MPPPMAMTAITFSVGPREHVSDVRVIGDAGHLLTGILRQMHEGIEPDSADDRNNSQRNDRQHQAPGDSVGRRADLSRRKCRTRIGQRTQR